MNNDIGLIKEKHNISLPISYEIKVAKNDIEDVSRYRYLKCEYEVLLKNGLQSKKIIISENFYRELGFIQFTNPQLLYRANLPDKDIEQAIISLISIVNTPLTNSGESEQSSIPENTANNNNSDPQNVQ